jgi:hypothetical protein
MYMSTSEMTSERCRCEDPRGYSIYIINAERGILKKADQILDGKLL